MKRLKVKFVDLLLTLIFIAGMVLIGLFSAKIWTATIWHAVNKTFIFIWLVFLTIMSFINLIRR